MTNLDQIQKLEAEIKEKQEKVKELKRYPRGGSQITRETELRLKVNELERDLMNCLKGNVSKDQQQEFLAFHCDQIARRQRNNLYWSQNGREDTCKDSRANEPEGRNTD